MSTQAEVAQALGLSDRGLRQLVSTGAISDPGRGNWEVMPTARQIIAYRDREIERMQDELTCMATQLERVSATKAEVALRKLKLQSDKAELGLAVKQGKLVPVEEVAEAWQTAALVMKTRLNAIAARAAPRAHAAPTIAAAESEIREEVDRALECLDDVGGSAEASKRHTFARL